MYIIFIFIIGGIFALGFGAEMIVRSSVNLANIYKVSGYFVGFTIVALGTSLPELASSIQAIQVVDSPGIAIGNIVCIYLIIPHAFPSPQLSLYPIHILCRNLR